MHSCFLSAAIILLVCLSGVSYAWCCPRITIRGVLTRRRPYDQSAFVSSQVIHQTPKVVTEMALALSNEDHKQDGGGEDGIDADVSLLALPRAKYKKKAYLLLQDVSDRIAKNDPKAVKKAKEMVERLDYLGSRVGVLDATVPTLRRGYILWIHAIAKSRGRSGSSNNQLERRGSVGSQAEAVLRLMQEKGVKPNLISYTSVMDAYAHDAKFDSDAPLQAERLLFELLHAIDDLSSLYSPDIELTSVVADTVMNAWAQQGTWEGALRALELLKRLDLIGKNSSSRPSIHSYATVLHGLATCRGGREAAETAEELLYRLLDRQRHDPSLKPDVIVFNAAMHCWANSNDPRSGMKSMRLLTELKAHGCQPDLVSHNTLLSAWSHSGHAQAGPQVEKLVKEMITSHGEDPGVAPAPNTISYNNILHAWSKSALDGAASRAEKVLRYMILAGKEEIAPDAYSFTSVLDTLAKSKARDKVIRAESILNAYLILRKTRHNLQLSQLPFNAVLNAAAFSATENTEQERQHILQIAVHTFKRMNDENVVPDAVSYGNLMKCFVNLMSAGASRTKLALRLFERCCEQGFVGDLVWNEAKKAIPSHLLAEKKQTKKG
ncbi:hypothetical protein MPSEU_000791800 [Mayamaea pseudoterrestris]|nr:hypothetical protein MPSEU_000791800 [Mayamaea pseudoterrestris]